MSILKRAIDTAFTIRFLRLLTMDWKKMKAYELGLINDEGVKLKKPKTSEEKAAYTFFHRLVFNIKRMLNLVPGAGARKLASYASALYLLKAHTNHSEKEIVEFLDIDDLDIIEEDIDVELIPNRRYQLNKDIMIPIASDLIEAFATKGSSITIVKPLGIHFGSIMYEATHNLSNKKIYVTEHDISADLNQEEINVTTVDVADIPSPLRTDYGDKYQRFTVPTGIFQKFDKGRKRYQRWRAFLDLNDELQVQIAQFARKHRDALIVLQDESTGAMRAIRPTSSDGK
jgi:hypothetical protein